jgi:hypothetical protein
MAYLQTCKNQLVWDYNDECPPRVLMIDDMSVSLPHNRPVSMSVSTLDWRKSVFAKTQPSQA